ncbi:hypothetical protein HAX54_049866, partial [Datura stramonium]|nr:hypothetical protein [Datura stramonium]
MALTFGSGKELSLSDLEDSFCHLIAIILRLLKLCRIRFLNWRKIGYSPGTPLPRRGFQSEAQEPMLGSKG